MVLLNLKNKNLKVKFLYLYFSSVAARTKIDPKIGPIQGVHPKPKAIPINKENQILLFFLLQIFFQNLKININYSN